MKDQEKDSDDMMADMTRQHIALKSEKTSEINYNNSIIVDNELEIEARREERRQALEYKNSVEAKKDKEIMQLENSIKTMTNNFHAMLKDTLEKMKDKIAFANSQWDDKNEQHLQEQAILDSQIM